MRSSSGRTATRFEGGGALAYSSALSVSRSSINRFILDELQMPVLRAIGAGAVAQTCKGIAIARGILAVRGVNLACDIGFDNVYNEQGEEISAQTFRLFLR